MKEGTFMKKIGLIGAGQMGGALLKGLLAANYILPEEIIVSGGKSGTAKALQEELHFVLGQTNVEVAHSDMVILAVTPKIMPSVLTEIKDAISKETLIISLAASMELKEYQDILGSDKKIVRAIPNTPVSIKAGMTAITFGENLTEMECELVNGLFQSVGETVVLAETKINSASTLSGCSPAFIAIFIEALADAGVLNGLSREEAYLLAEQSLIGTAKMALLSGKHPGAIKDDVCSPGGTTIQGVVTLEEYGFRNAVIKAINASTNHKH